GRKSGDPSVFSVAYVVRAVSPGRYVHPQAYVEDMYRPDRFGRTATGTVEVTAAKGWVHERQAQQGARRCRRPTGPVAMALLEPRGGIYRDHRHSVGGGTLDRRARSGAAGGGPRILDRGGGPRRQAAAALHHAGRALANAGDPREC